MSALGLQISVRLAGEAVCSNSQVLEELRKCEYNVASNTNFQRQRLAYRTRIRHFQNKRLYSTTDVFATTGAHPQSVGNSPMTIDSIGQGTKPSMLENRNVPDEQHVREKLQFDWNKQWYPIAVTKDLDKDAPYGVTIIGRPLAIWWDRTVSKWQVYADQCPHRLAPLSEGSISEDGLLRCSYHGWTFKGDSGECTQIPQAPRDGRQLHASKRACVTVYPSTEQQGIIWFWPDFSHGAVNVEAAANPPPVFPELSDPTFGFDISARDLEYSYESLIENLMDPSHVNFAHHKIQGNRKNATPLNFKVTSKITPEGFKGEDERGRAIFYPPCCFTLAFTLPNTKKDGIPGEKSGSLVAALLSTLIPKEEKSKEKVSKKVTLVFMCIPVSPGRSRVIWSFPRNFATFFINNTPKWILHITNNLVLDSDSYLLHLVDRRLEHEGPSNWFERCYAPTSADAYVHGFRKWLNEFAGGFPDWAGRFENRLPPSAPKRVVLDRYWTHVVRCKSCRGALRNFRALEVGLQALAIALVGLVATSALVPIRSVQTLAVPLVLGAVLSTLLSRWLAHIIYKTFYFHDYNHAAIK